MFMDKIVEDCENPNNYYNTYVKPQEEGEGFAEFAYEEALA